MTESAKAEFVEIQAHHLAAIDEAHEDAQKQVAAELAHLLETPEDRDTGIVVGIAGYLFLGQVNAGEDPAEEAGWWFRLRDLLALSWSDLHSITPAERSQDWQIAENVMLDWCTKQAETPILLAALTKTADDAPERAQALKAMTKAEAMQLGRAAGFANRSKALRVAALEGKRDAAEGDERAALDRQIKALKRRKVG